MAEAVGFKAVFMTGYGIRDAQLGMPDFGIATATEVVNIVRNMVNSVDIPFIVDADDGYGGALAAYRTTRELIRAGAAGLFLDDQKHPTKCPALGTQEVVPLDEYIGKLKAAIEARQRRRGLFHLRPHRFFAGQRPRRYHRPDESRGGYRRRCAFFLKVSIPSNRNPVRLRSPL